MSRSLRPHLLVVIPMKDPATAKTRLAPDLAPAARAAVAVGLFRATLQVLRQVRPLSARGFDIATVTASPRIAAIAREAGIEVIPEPEPVSLTEAAGLAARTAQAQGFSALCILPGDLAAPAPADLLRLLDHPVGRDAGPDVVLCPSADGGTNAFLARLPCPAIFAYGPQSFDTHLAAARAAGLRPLALRLESLRHDVDRMEHLVALTRPVPSSLPRPDLHP